MPPKNDLNCFICQSRNRSEWCVLGPDDLALVNKFKVRNVYSPGQMVFYEGNPSLGIYCIETGQVALKKMDPAGGVSMLRVASAGETLGYRAHFAGSKLYSSAEVLSEAQICFIDRAALDELLQRNPNLGLQFLKSMAEDLREADEFRLQLVQLPVRARLAHLLLSMKDRFGEGDDQGRITINLPISRQDLASMIGTRPETVSRIIQALEKEHVLTFEGRQVTVDDLDLLLDEIETEI